MTTATKTKQNELLALDANQATISTATVTIRTLRVNNKQLTQATFRQLPVRALINERSLELLGVVWGWVNYTPTGECQQSRQFVAQFGEELCRCPVWVRDFSIDNHHEWNGEMKKRGQFYYETRLNYILSRAIEGTLQFEPDDETYIFGIEGRHMFPETYVRIGPYGDFFDNLSMRAHMRSRHHPHREKQTAVWSEDQPIPGWRYPKVAVPLEDIEKEVGEAKNSLIGLMKKRTASFQEPSAWWDQRLDHIDRDADEYAGRWNALMDRLETAPQLFIAV